VLKTEAVHNKLLNLTIWTTEYCNQQSVSSLIYEYLIKEISPTINNTRDFSLATARLGSKRSDSK